MQSLQTGPGSVLLVCTANVVRSPAAEALLRNELDAGSRGIRVHSAGTDATTGLGISRTMGRLLDARGIDTSTHRSSQVTRDELLAATLVLALGAEHRARLAVLAPAARARTFTLLEFSRLASALLQRGTPQGELDDIVAEVSRMRSFEPTITGPSTVVDPRGRSRWAYRRTLKLMTSALGPVAELINAAAARP